jgi:hypothetical protein
MVWRPALVGIAFGAALIGLLEALAYGAGSKERPVGQGMDFFPVWVVVMLLAFTILWFLARRPLGDGAAFGAGAGAAALAYVLLRAPAVEVEDSLFGLKAVGGFLLMAAVFLGIPAVASALLAVLASWMRGRPDQAS